MFHPTYPETPDWYVSSENGNDGNTGTSEGQAFATLTKLLTVISPGDFCAIAPGNYRETPTASISGASDNHIVLFFDLNCRYFQNETKGRCRLTGCDSDEYPQITSGYLLDCMSTNYYDIYNLIMDGVKSGNITLVYSNWETYFYNCSFSGGRIGLYRGYAFNCYSKASVNAFIYGNYLKCFGIGYIAFSSANTEQCIGISTKERGFYNGNDKNSIAFGGQYGFLFGSFYGSIAVCSSIAGFYNSSASYEGLIAINCERSCAGDGVHLFDLSKIKEIECINAPSNYTGDRQYGKMINFIDVADIEKIFQAFNPALFFEMFSDDTVSLTHDTDVMGRLRRAIDGVINAGPYEKQDVSIDEDNYHILAPGVRIDRKGQVIFKIPVLSSRSYTIKSWVKFDSDAAKKPQMIVRGEGIITETTDTATGDGSSFEELSCVIGTPERDGTVEAVLYARDETSAKYAIFSDLKVT